MCSASVSNAGVLVQASAPFGQPASWCHTLCTGDLGSMARHVIYNHRRVHLFHVLGIHVIAFLGAVCRVTVFPVVLKVSAEIPLFLSRCLRNIAARTLVPRTLVPRTLSPTVSHFRECSVCVGSGTTAA